MPDVEFNSAEPDEELPARRPRPARSAMIALVALAAVIALAVALTHRGSGHPAARPSSSPARVVVSAPRPTPVPAPGPALVGPDALASTGVFAVSGSLGSADVSYDFDLVNQSTSSVTISYPIQLVGPNGTAIPLVFAGFYDEEFAARHINDSVAPAQRLVRLSAGLSTSLLLRVHIDCDNAALRGQTPQDQPAVHVRLAGFAAPEVLTFDELASGFSDAVRQVCGS